MRCERTEIQCSERRRLGVADAPKDESQAKAVDETPVIDENIVLDDDGFLGGCESAGTGG